VVRVSLELIHLGTLYLQGSGVERNDEEAALDALRGGGMPSALAALGLPLPQTGKGVPRDVRKAADLIQNQPGKNDVNCVARLSSHPVTR